MINKKEATWKSLKDFQSLVVSRQNPLMVSIEKQVTNKDKVTIFWEEDSCSSLFDETETFKVSISLKLAELLNQSGLITKQNSTSSEEEFMELLLKKIAEKNSQVETAE